MTKVCIAAIFLSTIINTTSAASKINLLKNPDFKYIAGNGHPKSWSVCSWLRESCRKNAEGLTVSIDEARKNHGYISQVIHVKPGHIYRAGIRLKSSINKISYLQIKLFKGNKELKRINGGYGTVDKTEIIKKRILCTEQKMKLKELKKHWTY